MSRSKPPVGSWCESASLVLTPSHWLVKDGPDSDVVLSTRVRLLRNLRGHRFPHHADRFELELILDEIRKAMPHGYEIVQGVSSRERDYWIGTRLVSPSFPWSEPGRALLVDPQLRCGLMVNEEDHLRLQILDPGWSIDETTAEAYRVEGWLAKKLSFASSERFGYLAASPYNRGEGRRLSAMLHLVGLAQSKQLPDLVRALATNRIIVRGLFGESSRAIGAFVQVSITQGKPDDFVGACEYLIAREREARIGIDQKKLKEHLERVLHYAIAAKSMSLANSLRVIAWVRLATVSGVAVPVDAKEVDSWLTQLNVHGPRKEDKSAMARADYLRPRLEKLL